MKKRIIALISFLCYIICWAQAADEHYYFKNLSIQDGLSQNSVTSILQDRKGFMWFGTKDGLNRYDGFSFRKFKYDELNNNSIGNNFVTALYEDKKGNIWVGTDVGLYIYYPDKDAFEHFAEQTSANIRIDKAISMISSDAQGQVWIAVESQGLFCYNLDTRSLTNFPLNNYPHITTNIKSFTFDNSGVLWIGFYGDGLFYSKDGLKTLLPYSTRDGSSEYVNDVVSDIVSGAYNCLYIGSAKGGLKFRRRATN